MSVGSRNGSGRYARLRADTRLSLGERNTCTRWQDDPFASRRNTLTHLLADESSFEEACRRYESDPRLLLDEIQSVSLAVFRANAEAMQEQAPQEWVVDAAWRDIEWIDA